MPFFTLGFLVGNLANKIVKKVLKPYFEEKDTCAGEYDSKPKSIIKIKNPDVPQVTKNVYLNAEVNQMGRTFNLTTDFCRFSNSFNNCWLNATLQAFLKLDILKQKLRVKPALLSEVLLEAPEFAKLVETALHNPGKGFFSVEICTVLKELSVLKPSLGFNQHNDVLDFLDPFLLMLQKCGVETTLQVKKVITCDKCPNNGNSITRMGNVLFLPPPGKHDTPASLLFSVLNRVNCEEKCGECNNNLRKDVSFILPDVITLYLPRPANISVCVPAVDIDDLFIDLANGKVKYRLKSVISHKALSFCDDHFYTYVTYENMVIKANDELMRVADEACFDDLNKNGIVYVYEKCTEDPRQDV